MNKRNLFVLSFVILIALLTGACSGSGEISSVSEEALPVAENPAPKPEVIETENPTIPTQSSGSVSYLFSPIRSTSTYLMDAEGNALHIWESAYTPGKSVYLLENGNLLRTGSVKPSKFSDTGGSGGIVEEIAPDGAVVWAYQYANGQVQQHHDIEQMPNGNILIIAWEVKTMAEAIDAGRNPSLLNEGELWPDHVVEVDPSSNTIVWEWHIWDHLVQDHDASKENYGVVGEHPELIDINLTTGKAAADWNHINSIDYNAKLDQILLSVHGFSEIWIIDHATSTEEAAGAAGDLLYRWGNPQVYDAGSSSDQQLYVQHDVQWIPDGYPGAGNILIFNNGNKRDRPYSSVDEIVPPLNADGGYTFTGTSYGPEARIWTYVAENLSGFFAKRISGAQRLANGNTLICSGPEGIFFEVTPTGEVVWRYDYGAEVFRVLRYEANYIGLPDLVPGSIFPLPTSSDTDKSIEGQNNDQQEQRPRLDFAAASVKLGVSEEVLKAALGTRPFDFASAAAKLGITEEALLDALGIPAGGATGG
jgi:hypothetical protein